MRVLDLGGGMPADYDSDLPDDPRLPSASLLHAIHRLRTAAPELFDESRWTLVTEFGRYARRNPA